MIERPKDTRTPEERRAAAVAVLADKRAEADQLRAIAENARSDEILIYSGSASAIAIDQAGKPSSVPIADAPSFKAIVDEVGIAAVRRLNLTGDVVESAQRRDVARRALDSLEILIADMVADQVETGAGSSPLAS